MKDGITELTEWGKGQKPSMRQREGTERREKNGQLGKTGSSHAHVSPVHGKNSVNSVIPSNSSAIAKVARLLKKKEREKGPPEIRSFAEFLERHAQVKSGSGYVPYHFAGREALREIVARLDLILASGEPDASLAICGGAQFGKTVLLLNLLAPALDLASVRLPQRVGVPPKEVRQTAAQNAVRLLEQVAAGIFNIEEPLAPTSETTEAPRPTIVARRRHFTPREEEGV